MTSDRNPYARPPSNVFVFAHVAHEHGADFVPAGSLEGANTAQPVFVYGKRYVQRPYAVEVDPVALPLKDEEGGAKRFVLAGLTEFGVSATRPRMPGGVGSLRTSSRWL